MSSANGFVVCYSNAFGSWEYRASWAAPFFVFVDGMECAEDGAPLGVIHCEDRAHAERVARHGGSILGPDFEPLS